MFLKTMGSACYTAHYENPEKPHNEIHYHENANLHEGNNCFWFVKF